MIWVSIVLSCTYVLLIGGFYYGIQKSTPLKIKDNSDSYFSIVIAFRNESEKLPALLDSILQLTYPTNKFEILFINDHSNDNSEKIINTFSDQNPQLSIQLLQSNQNGKKAAISLGIHKAKHHFIVTTDADCILPNLWLQAYNSKLKEKDYYFIAGPVALKSSFSFLDQFQNIDFLSLQGSTLGSFGLKKYFMSNAANCGFSKDVFLTLNGYKGSEHIASGDDVFLLEKIAKKHPSKIGYIYSDTAIVETTPQKTWKQLMYQRMRWAAKATAYKNIFAVAVGCIVFSCNLLLLALLFINMKLLLFVFTAKATIDYLLLAKTSTFFSKKITVINLIRSSILYPFFSVGIYIATLLFEFEWKGRLLKK